MYLVMTSPFQLFSPSGLSVSQASNSTSAGRTQNRPLIAPDPPSPLPRGQVLTVPFASAWTSVLYCQSKSVPVRPSRYEFPAMLI